VTAGGLIGQVSKVVNENEIQVEIAEDVRVRVVRNNVQEVLSKTEPAQGEGGQKQPANEQGGAKGMLGKLMGGGQAGGGSNDGGKGGSSSGGSSSGGGQKKN
jgi:preprotein translocase subunit YajC